ncbi:MAG TPA: thiamine phosphate synthase [Phycisphaerales bacterium]|nr:thiamine phosphate synthase [Phycisphaerales bacterium]
MADSLLRIIDANANRAREALRVMEDVARFVLNSTELSKGLKHLRHDFQGAVELLPADRLRLLAARDTPGDVGTVIKTRPEMCREGVARIAAAAGSRLTEALRSLEEAAKALTAPGAAAAFEQVRYRAYTWDQRLALALGAFDRRRQWRLCVLITESLCRVHGWQEVARLALEGGADSLQLREKTLDSRELLERARILVQLAAPHGAAVIVNDRPDIALLAGAQGVHVGQTDLHVHEVRRITGSRLLVGVSTENMEQAVAAVEAGADYCGVGPMFPTTTKGKPRIVGPQYLKDYLRDERTREVPHLAIGGITAENIGRLLEVGVRGVAVSSVVCGAEDPAAVCRRLVGAISTAPVSGP